MATFGITQAVDWLCNRGATMTFQMSDNKRSIVLFVGELRLEGLHLLDMVERAKQIEYRRKLAETK